MRRVPASEHPGRTASERSDGLDRSNGLDFGDEADRGIEDQDANDCAAFLPFPKVERYRGSNSQQRNHETLKLMNKDGN